MKTLFQAFAKYNSSVNQSVLELVTPLPKEDVVKKTKAYFPSIYETLFHILLTDLLWLRRYSGAIKGSKALNSNPLAAYEEKDLRRDFESDYKKLYQYRKQLDEVILQFVQELDENQLTSLLRYKNYKGEELEKELWKTMLHWFNHQTHHRGQISVLLDLIGIDHDYSNLVSRV